MRILPSARRASAASSPTSTIAATATTIARHLKRKVGLTWIRDHTLVDKASCWSIIWDPKVFNGVMQMNENTVIKEFHSSENEYFHPDFHSSMNMGIEYLGTAHGEKDVKEYLAVFAKNAYKALLDKMKSDPLGTLAKHIEATYALEKASDALTLSIEGDTLSVFVSYCPAVKHLRKTGWAV